MKKTMEPLPLSLSWTLISVWAIEEKGVTEKWEARKTDKQGAGWCEQPSITVAQQSPGIVMVSSLLEGAETQGLVTQ